MIPATQLRVGMTILYNGEPYRVLTVQHITPGNWRGMVQTKLRSLKTGSSVENRFRSEDKLEKAALEQHEMEYLYNDGTDYHFMNSETYEQVVISGDVLGDNVYYLVPNIKFMIEYYSGLPVGVEPPKVVEPPPGERDKREPQAREPDPREDLKKDVQLQRAVDLLKAMRILERSRPAPARAEAR